MKKIYRLLNKLSTSEMRELHTFLLSPYFNKSLEVNRFFEYLKKHHSKTNYKYASDERIAFDLYPQVKNSMKKVESYRSKLVKYIERFLAIQEFEDDLHLRNFLLVKALSKKTLPRLFDSVMLQIKKDEDKRTVYKLQDYQNRINLAHFKYFHPSTNKFLESGHLLIDVLNQLEAYYVKAKISYLYELLERINKFEESAPFDIIQTTTALLEKDVDDNPLFHIIKKLLELHTREITFDALEDVKSQYLALFPNFSFEDKQAVLKYIINAGNEALSAGKNVFLPVLFELYQFGCEYNLLTFEGYITDTSFINVTMIASRLGKSIWLDNFIRTYSSFLKPATKDDILKFADAIKAFNFGDIMKSGTILKEINSQSRPLQYACRSLEVKICFEEFLANDSNKIFLLDSINAYRRKIRERSGFSETKKKRYFTYFSLLKSLIEAHSPPSAPLKELLVIKNQILHAEVIQKIWLTEKIDYLIQKETGNI